jgi:6-phosphogluconolactonase (cycloisomerase 2 family)
MHPPEAATYTIDFAGGGVHRLTELQVLPTIKKPVTINGKKQSVTIDGGATSTGLGGDEARAFGIFFVQSGGVLTLNELVLTGGNFLAGGAVNNTAGVVIIRESRFVENQAATDAQLNGEGGAIWSTGPLSITKSFFGENVALNEGGAIYAGGGANTVIVESTFVKNQTLNGGGAIYSGAGGTNVMQILKSDFVENKVAVPTRSSYDILADDAIGGAIKNAGNFYGYRLSFERNYTENTKGGGAFANKASDSFDKVQLVESAFADNYAETTLANVPQTFGGAIYNEGEMLIKATSIHNNRARVAGGIFNRNKHIVLANVTIASNEALTLGGFGNGSPLHANSEFGTASFYHVTHANNQDQVDQQSPLFTLKSHSIYLFNSIIDGGCLNKILYSNGHNLFGKACATVPEPGGNQTPNPPPVSDLGLQSLTYNGGPELNAGFYSIKLNGNSPAIDAGAHGDDGCDFSAVAHRDQINRDRDANPDFCDAGALESGTTPPKWKTSEQGNRGFAFPLIIQKEQTTSSYSIEIGNSGGGIINWQLQFEENPGLAYWIASGPPSGALARNQSVTINLQCKPLQFGEYLGVIVFKTDLPDQPVIRHRMYCRYLSENLGTAMWSYNPQKPVSAGSAAPGSPTTVQQQVGNLGSQPANANVKLKKEVDYFQLLMKAKGVAAANQVSAAGVAQDFTIPPGGELLIDVICTPPGPGLFVNTLEIATNDPAHPLYSYDVSCEGVDPAQAQKLQPAELYKHASPSALWGIAVSPDGTQLLAGRGSSNVLETFSRNPATGQLTRGADFAEPNMSSIRDIVYSRDGKYVYYTSYFGNGIVELKRAANGALTSSKVITKDSAYLLCIIPNPVPHLGLCLTNAMIGAFGVALSPDERNLYVVGEGDSTLSVFVRNPVSDTIVMVQKLDPTTMGNTVLDGAGDVLVSPDGKHLYVTARTGDAISVFRRGVSGVLTFLRAYKDGDFGLDKLNFPGNMAMSADGKFLYVPSYTDDALSVFARSAADGGLELVQMIPNLNGVFDVALSHDSAQIRLVASLFDGDALQIYQRNEKTGQLTFIETHQHSLPVSAIDTPTRIAASPDDGQIYLSLTGSHGVRAFNSINAVPVLFSTAPASVQAGGSAFVLQVTGVRFAADSVIVWNGEVLPTTVENGQTLLATIDGSKIANAGSATIVVRTPQPGGGDSNAVTFAITAADEAGLPAITSLTPPAVTPGSGDLALLVQGTNFTPQSQVLVNGKAVATSYLNPTTLMALLLAADLNAEGPVAITVVNGGSVAAAAVTEQTSSAVKFVMAPAGTVAQPALRSLSPQSAVAGSGDLLVIVQGYNFSLSADQGTVALWNGDQRPTTVLDANTLLMQLSATDLLAPGSAEVSVYTPGLVAASALPFVIRNAGDNPQPLVTGHSVEVTGEQWTLLLSGEDFVAGAKLLLNGSERPVTAVTPSRVLATLSTADLVNGGLLQLVNPAPGGGPSNLWVLAPRQNQSINFAPATTYLLHSNPVSPVAISTSGLPVAFSSMTPAVCTAEETDTGWRVTLVALGNCTLVATQAGDGAFNPAPSVERTFQVAAAGTVYLPVALRVSKPAVQAADVVVTTDEGAPFLQPEADPAAASLEYSRQYYLPLVAQ